METEKEKSKDRYKLLHLEIYKLNYIYMYKW